MIMYIKPFAKVYKLPCSKREQSRNRARTEQEQSKSRARTEQEPRKNRALTSLTHLGVFKS